MWLARNIDLQVSCLRWCTRGAHEHAGSGRSIVVVRDSHVMGLSCLTSQNSSTRHSTAQVNRFRHTRSAVLLMRWALWLFLGMGWPVARVKSRRVENWTRRSPRQDEQRMNSCGSRLGLMASLR